MLGWKFHPDQFYFELTVNEQEYPTVYQQQIHQS